MKALIMLAAIALAGLAAEAPAQDKRKFFFKAPPASSRYTQQHIIEVGDAPGHQLRIAEIQAKYPTEAPQFDGVRATAAVTWLSSDYVDGSGRGQGYQVYMMETGERIFARVEILTRTHAGVDGTRRSRFDTLITLTGGTGNFRQIRGTLRATGATDFKLGTSGVQTEGEYWFEAR